mmetsp:Transcript_15566/g.24583  ORF Transcript_15566/g.24583 Transcript_15566/m.24583 type:complete len:446 (-) Transcript_15566:27-1364(-)
MLLPISVRIIEIQHRRIESLDLKHRRFGRRFFVFLLLFQIIIIIFIFIVLITQRRFRVVVICEKHISRQRIPALLIKQFVAMILVHHNSAKARLHFFEPVLLMIGHRFPLVHRVLVVVDILAVIDECVVSIMQPTAVDLDRGERVSSVSQPVHAIDAQTVEVGRRIKQLVHKGAHIDAVHVHIDRHHIVKRDTHCSAQFLRFVEQKVAIHHKALDAKQLIAESRHFLFGLLHFLVFFLLHHLQQFLRLILQFVFLCLLSSSFLIFLLCLLAAFFYVFALKLLLTAFELLLSAQPLSPSSFFILSLSLSQLLMNDRLVVLDEPLNLHMNVMEFVLEIRVRVPLQLLLLYAVHEIILQIELIVHFVVLRCLAFTVHAKHRRRVFKHEHILKLLAVAHQTELSPPFLPPFARLLLFNALELVHHIVAQMQLIEAAVHSQLLHDLSLDG